MSAQYHQVIQQLFDLGHNLSTQDLSVAYGFIPRQQNP